MDQSIDPRRLRAWRLFLETHARVIEVLEDELQREHDLALTWYDVLVQLSEAPDQRLRMQDLAGAVLLSKSGLTRLIDRMEAAGLVTRRDCADDRRGTFAVLTPAGRQRLREAAPTHLRGIREHFTGLLSDEEIGALRAGLGRIVERHARQPAAGPAGRT